MSWVGWTPSWTWSACCWAWTLLGVEQVIVSPSRWAAARIHTAHGELPLPAPATLALLRGVPIVGSEIEKELVTPTGAALLTSLAAGYGPIPAMTLSAIGYGAGGRDLPIPNVVRLLLGDRAASGQPRRRIVVVLETNIDDLNPEIYDHVMARLFKAGALDVFLTPIQMKKNRPGTLFRVICRPGDAAAMTDILLRGNDHAGRAPADHGARDAATPRARGCDALRRRARQGRPPSRRAYQSLARIRRLPPPGGSPWRSPASGVPRRRTGRAASRAGLDPRVSRVTCLLRLLAYNCSCDQPQ